MADTGAPPHEPGLEARVSRLESDVAEIKATLNRMAPLIDEMHGYMRGMLPNLATKAELSELNAILPNLATKAELSELNAILPNLATKAELSELKATLPNLATKAELTDLRTEFRSALAEQRSESRAALADQRAELKAEMAELRLQIIQRPTRRQSVFDIFAIVALIGAILTIAERLTH